MKYVYDSIAIVAVLLLLLLIGLRQTELGDPYRSPTSVASAKLRQLYNVWSHKTQSGARYEHVTTIDQLSSVEGYDEAWLRTYSAYTKEDTDVVYDEAAAGDFAHGNQGIIFYFIDPIRGPFSIEGEERPASYMGVTRGGNIEYLDALPASE